MGPPPGSLVWARLTYLEHHAPSTLHTENGWTRYGEASCSVVFHVPSMQIRFRCHFSRLFRDSCIWFGQIAHIRASTESIVGLQAQCKNAPCIKMGGSLIWNDLFGPSPRLTYLGTAHIKGTAHLLVRGLVYSSIGPNCHFGAFCKFLGECSFKSPLPAPSPS